MGCMILLPYPVTSYIWYETVSKDTVGIFLSKNQKCVSCKKGYGHSFVAVSTCRQCGMFAHTRCIVEMDTCPICHPE